MSVTLCPHGARGLMACPECEKAAFKPKPTTKRRCRICGGNHGEEWHALGAYAKIVEEERDQAERERDEARAALAVERQHRDGHLPSCAGIDHEEGRCGCGYLDGTAYRDMTARLEQATALLREAEKCLLSKNAGWHVGVSAQIDAFLSGQPAPAKVAVDDAMVERAQTAYTDAIVKSMSCNNDTMKEHPMHAALVVALEGRG